jgi:D-glycero-alpha-D-manno-heptose-7-phosphate kinase
MSLENLTISINASIREALSHIHANHKGFVLVVDEMQRAVGIATDGDIRRRLLEGASLTDPISSCANADFVWAGLDTPREVVLKQLDHRIRVIPILDAERRLISVLTRDHLPGRAEERVYSRAKAPVRISFGGGGSDVSPYFSEHSGAVINATISLHSHATLRVRDDEQLFVHSRDLNSSENFKNLDAFLGHEGCFGLIQSVIKAIRPSFGFELFLQSDFPMSSGLGGSAVVTASILGCFNQFRHDRWDQHELAELAFQAERLHFGVAGGWQDQYATVFGGLNFMEFNHDQNVIHPIRLPREVMLELEESLILCNTGTTHDSGHIHEDQKEQTKSEEIRKKIQANVELTYRMRNHLLRGRLLEFGKCLNTAWEIKRGFSSRISNQWLDTIYERALSSGVIGGKLLGAGGGGFFLFYVPPFARHQVLNWLQAEGMAYTPFRFEDSGLQSWTVREKMGSQGFAIDH